MPSSSHWQSSTASNTGRPAAARAMPARMCADSDMPDSGRPAAVNRARVPNGTLEIGRLATVRRTAPTCVLEVGGQRCCQARLADAAGSGEQSAASAQQHGGDVGKLASAPWHWPRRGHPTEHGRPIPSATPEQLDVGTVDRHHHVVNERRGYIQTGQDGGEMSSDEIEMAIIDRQVLMDLGHPATQVLGGVPRAPWPRTPSDEHGGGRRSTSSKKRANSGIAEHPLVQLLDGDIDAHDAAEALEDRDGGGSRPRRRSDHHCSVTSERIMPVRSRTPSCPCVREHPTPGESAHLHHVGEIVRVCDHTVVSLPSVSPPFGSWRWAVSPWPRRRSWGRSCRRRCCGRRRQGEGCGCGRGSAAVGTPLRQRSRDVRRSCPWPARSRSGWTAHDSSCSLTVCGCRPSSGAARWRWWRCRRGLGGGDVVVGQRAGLGAEQVEGTDDLPAQPHRDGVSGEEPGLDGDRSERGQRPSPAAGGPG